MSLNPPHLVPNLYRWCQEFHSYLCLKIKIENVLQTVLILEQSISRKSLSPSPYPTPLSTLFQEFHSGLCPKKKKKPPPKQKKTPTKQNKTKKNKQNKTKTNKQIKKKKQQQQKQLTTNNRECSINSLE